VLPSAFRRQDRRLAVPPENGRYLILILSKLLPVAGLVDIVRRCAYVPYSLWDAAQTPRGADICLNRDALSSEKG